MTSRWTTASLETLCTIEIGRTPPRDVPRFWDPDRRTENVWVSIADMKSGVSPNISQSKERLSDEGAALVPIVRQNSLLLSFKLSLGKLAFAARDLRTNEAIAALVPRDETILSRHFLYWYLRNFDWVTAATGSEKIKGATLNKAKLREIPISFPPLSKQEEIAAALDLAFKGIEKAAAHATVVLSASEKLLERTMAERLTRKPPTSVATVKELALPQKGAIRTGPFGSQLLHGEFVDEGIAVLGIDNVVENRFAWKKRRYVTQKKYAALSRYTVKPGDVLISIMGTCGRCAVVPDDVGTAINSKHLVCISLDRAKCLPEFLQAYFLFHPAARQYLSKHSKGSIMDGLNMGLIQAMPVELPSLADQREVATKMGELRDVTERLGDVQQRKLSLLAELEAALLTRAFQQGIDDVSDQSSASSNVSAGAGFIEFTARVLAFAYNRHVSQQRSQTFGHVKAQKTLHLVETIGKVDLARAPIKDAAGPNDFPHMLKAEKWAKENQFFEFVKRSGGGYDFKKLAQFDKLHAASFALFQPHRKGLEKAVDLVIPMDSEAAEIFATVHAAWNNLLAGGKEVTDAAILREAREDWHPDKLAIPEHKFKEAIKDIRRKGLEPDGTAKPVRGQESLF